MSLWNRRPIPMPPDGSKVQFTHSVSLSSFLLDEVTVSKAIRFPEGTQAVTLGVFEQKSPRGKRKILLIAIDRDTYQISLASPRFLPSCLALVK